MNALSKGGGPINAKYAQGGEVLQKGKSRFMKTPDSFRTGVTTSEYKKTGKGGELSKLEGDDKSEKAIKPRT